MTKTIHDPFTPLSSTTLAAATGGAHRKTGRDGAATTQLVTMMTQINESIKELATAKPKNDPMQMMLPMMMMRQH